MRRIGRIESSRVIRVRRFRRSSLNNPRSEAMARRGAFLPAHPAEFFLFMAVKLHGMLFANNTIKIHYRPSVTFYWTTGTYVVILGPCDATTKECTSTRSNWTAFTEFHRPRDLRHRASVRLREKGRSDELVMPKQGERSKRRSDYVHRFRFR